MVFLQGLPYSFHPIDGKIMFFSINFIKLFVLENKISLPLQRISNFNPLDYQELDNVSGRNHSLRAVLDSIYLNQFTWLKM